MSLRGFVRKLATGHPLEAVGELFKREPPTRREPPREPPRQPPQGPDYFPPEPPEIPEPPEPPGIGRGGPPIYPVGEATFIAEGYGPVRMRFTTRRSLSYAATWYVNVGWYARGGSRIHNTDYYAARIESLEGVEVRGYVLNGPDAIVGTTQALTLETSLDMIDDYYNTDPSFASSINAPGS